MQKTEKISWKDTNLALLGSELDHKVKAATAENESAWDGLKNSNDEALYIWRIEQFQVKPWPKDQYGQFFKGDSYIILKSYMIAGSDTLKYDIHIWIGSESTQDEYGTAAYKMVEADEYLGGLPIQHRQVEGKESKEFDSYFKNGIEYLDGGVESGFNKVEATPNHPLFFQVKGKNVQSLKIFQVPLSKKSMNEGDSFILAISKEKVYCWHGKEARPIEKASANAHAETFCTLGTVVTLDQDDGDDEITDFWSYLADTADITIAPAVPDEEDVEEFVPVLYRVNGDITKPLEKIATAKKSIQKGTTGVRCFDEKPQFLEDDVWLLDGGWDIYIWIGSKSSREEKIAAMGAADKYAAEIDDRANYVPVTILKSGQETMNDKFMSYFE